MSQLDHRLNPAEQANCEALERKFREGVAQLTRNGVNGEQLRWFVVIGEPGAGKTQAISHSGMEFPRVIQDRYQGTGGTVNVDWWFTRDGFLPSPSCQSSTCCSA